MFAVKRKPYRSYSASFKVSPDQLANKQFLEIGFKAHALFSKYYFAITLDDLPPFLVFNHNMGDDSGILLGGLGADAAGPRLTSWRSYRLLIPAELLSPKRHKIRFTLRTLSDAGSLLTAVTRIRVSLR